MLTTFFLGIPTSSFIDRSRLLAVELINDILENVLGSILIGIEGIILETRLLIFDSMLTSLFWGTFVTTFTIQSNQYTFILTTFFTKITR